MNRGCRVFVTTSDAYLPALRPCLHQLNKYWRLEPPEVVVMGFRPPAFKLPPNAIFYSVGDQADYPFDKWSDAVIAFLQHATDDVFLLILEDMWPVRAVDGRAVWMLADYMRQFQDVARVDLTGDRLYAHGMQDYAPCGWLDLVKSMPGSPYHLSLMAGLWNREHMLSILEPGWSPHQVELVGTQKLSHRQDLRVMGTRQWPFRHCLALRGTNSERLTMQDAEPKLSDADAQELRALGYLKHWEGPP